MQICKFAGNLSIKRAVPFFEERLFRDYIVCVTSFLIGFHKQP